MATESQIELWNKGFRAGVSWVSQNFHIDESGNKNVKGVKVTEIIKANSSNGHLFIRGFKEGILTGLHK